MKENIEEKYMFPDEYEAFILNELCHFPGHSVIPCTVMN